MSTTPPNNATLTLFKSQTDAEAAIRQLARNGYDLGKVSMVGRETDGAVLAEACVNENGQPGTEAKLGGRASLGEIRTMLVGSGYFVVPGIGPLAIAGPLLTSIVRAMGLSPGLNKLDAMGAGLRHLGIPDDSIVRCKEGLKVGKVVVIAEGSAMAMILAREVFRRTPVEMIEQHVRRPD